LPVCSREFAILLSITADTPVMSTWPGTKFGSKPCGLQISIRKPYIPGIDFQAQWAYRYS